MKVAFLTDGKSPVPATKGGAVENLIEDLLDENEKKHEFSFSVLGLYEDTAFRKSQQYKYTDFHLVKSPGLIELLDLFVYHIAKILLKKILFHTDTFFAVYL